VIREIGVPVIRSELQFFEGGRKLHRADPMIYQETFPGERPESFDPVDVDLPL